MIHALIKKLSLLLKDWKLKDLALTYHDIEYRINCPLVGFERKCVDIEMKQPFTFLSKVTGQSLEEVTQRVRGFVIGTIYIEGVAETIVVRVLLRVHRIRIHALVP